MQLELTAALSPLRHHTFISAMRVLDAQHAVLEVNTQVANPVTAAEIAQLCRSQGLDVEIESVEIESVEMHVRIARSLTRKEIMNVGAVIARVLTDCGSEATGELAEPKQVVRLTPHERDLVENVPPHHGE